MIDMNQKIKDVARAICKADGWGNPDLVLNINDSAFGKAAADVAIPIWKKYIKAAEAALKEI